MPRPRLTFACELDSARLTGLFADPSVVTHLQALSARVAMMVPRLLVSRLRDSEQVAAAQAAYMTLIDRIRADGYGVEHYQFPVICISTASKGVCGRTSCRGWSLLTGSRL